MKVLNFSDLHTHNYKEFSIIEGDINSRLQDCVDVLEAIRKSAHEHKVDMIWFTGDLFHLKNNLDNKVIQLTMQKMKQIAISFPMLLVPGHHDLYMWSSNPVLLNMLGEFSDTVKVVTEPGWIHDFDIPIYAEPCTRKISELISRVNDIKTNMDENPVFLAHQDMLGMHYGGFVVEQGLDAEILSSKFRWSMIGHYHNHQKLWSNVISVGAPLQHNFGDANQERGWCILDTVTNELKYIQNEFSPRFLDITTGQGDRKDTDIPGNPDKDFYRIKVVGEVIPDWIDRIRWKRVSHEIKSRSKQRSTISFSDKKEDIIVKYVEARAGDLDHKKLIDLGREYL